MMSYEKRQNVPGFEIKKTRGVESRRVFSQTSSQIPKDEQLQLLGSNKMFAAFPGREENLITHAIAPTVLPGSKSTLRFSASL